MSDSSANIQKEVFQDGPGGYWHLYIVKCCNGTLYTGITTDVDRRFAEHQRGGAKGARYLRGKGPLELVYQTVAGDRARASVLEYCIKSLPKAAKKDLIAGRLDVATLWSAAFAENKKESGGDE